VVRYGTAWSIGRANVNKCDILIENDTVSGVHATLNLINRSYYIVDNGSMNGTYVINNADEQEANTFIKLSNGDFIKFGNAKFTYQKLIESSSYSTGATIRDFEKKYGKSNNQKEKIEQKEEPKGKKIFCKECMNVAYKGQECKDCGHIN